MTRKSLIQLGLFAALIIMVPCQAYANMGTPLMWAGALHLLIGNAIIGFIEGEIIAIAFKTKKLWSILVMIVANYISMWTGAFILNGLTDKLQSMVTIYNITVIFCALIAISFLITFIIEWPFCLFLFRRKEKRIKRSLLANLITQSISYILLIAFYALPSGASLITDVKIDKTLSFATTQKMWVYYISPNDGDVYRIRPNGSANEKVMIEDIIDKLAKLFIRPSADAPYSDLCVLQRSTDYVLIKHFTAEPMTLYYSEKDKQPFWFGLIDLRPQDQRDWEVSVGFWAAEGLSVKNKVNGKEFNLAMETPFVNLSIKNITILPGNQLVLQINYNQIALLDLNTKELGLITLGRGPLVIMEK